MKHETLNFVQFFSEQFCIEENKTVLSPQLSKGLSFKKQYRTVYKLPKGEI